ATAYMLAGNNPYLYRKVLSRHIHKRDSFNIMNVIMMINGGKISELFLPIQQHSEVIRKERNVVKYQDKKLQEEYVKTLNYLSINNSDTPWIIKNWNIFIALLINYCFKYQIITLGQFKKICIQLGDALLGVYNHVFAAHVCYLIAGKY